MRRLTTQSVLVETKLDNVGYAIHHLLRNVEPAITANVHSPSASLVSLQNVEIESNSPSRPLEASKAVTEPGAIAATSVMTTLNLSRGVTAGGGMDIVLHRPLTTEINFDQESEIKQIQSLQLSAMHAFASNQYEEAEKLLTKVVELSESMYGEYYPWRDQTSEMFVRSLYCRGSLDEAEVMAWKAADSLTKMLGETHPSTYRAMLLLMRILVVKGKEQELAELEKHIPSFYWNDDCYEIILLSRPSASDGAKRIGTCNIFSQGTSEESGSKSSITSKMEGYPAAVMAILLSTSSPKKIVKLLYVCSWTSTDCHLNWRP